MLTTQDIEVAPPSHTLLALSISACTLHSTEMFVNIVCMNISWSASRMGRRLEHNMTVLEKTITGIVRDVNHTMICLCEVGDETSPVCEALMQQLETAIMHSWTEAATEHIQLRNMFTTGSPYMTIYMTGFIECSNHQILHPLYSAQTFVCSLPDGESVDVINVHAPSGARRLRDHQRKTLLTNLLQSNSQARPGCTIGHANL